MSSFLLRDALSREVPLYFLWDGTTTDSGCPLATILKLWLPPLAIAKQAIHKIISYAEFMKLNALLDCIMSTDVAATL